MEKLNARNYRVWAAQIKAILAAKGLLKYIQLRSDTPRETVDKEFVDKEKQQVIATLLCTIDAKYVELIMDKENPYEMWQTLEKSHKSKCAASQHTLRNRLMNLQMKSSSTIREFANEICSLENELSYAGHSLHDSDKKYVLLNGLRDDFEIKKTILQEKYDMTFEGEDLES